MRILEKKYIDLKHFTHSKELKLILVGTLTQQGFATLADILQWMKKVTGIELTNNVNTLST